MGFCDIQEGFWQNVGRKHTYVTKRRCVQIHVRFTKSHLTQLHERLTVECDVSEHGALCCPSTAGREADGSNILWRRAKLELCSQPCGYTLAVAMPGGVITAACRLLICIRCVHWLWLRGLLTVLDPYERLTAPSDIRLRKLPQCAAKVAYSALRASTTSRTGRQASRAAAASCAIGRAAS